jgi:serine phosphatase RsbU (regulator of sigma subunit)
MSSETLSSRLDRHWMFFTFAMTLIVVVYVLYGVNMVRWRNSPDFGWRTMYNSGPNVVAEVLEAGHKAGLRAGDNILAINGRPYTTFDELYFEIRHDEPGSINTYTVQRDGETLEIGITTSRIGWVAVLWRSGGLLVIGLVYVLIGVLVFLMKPQAVESWLFLVMTTFLGIHVSYNAPSDLMRPMWLFDVRLFVDVFFPAPIIHLGLRFPKTRSFLHRMPWLWVVPYLLSLIHFVLYQITIEHYWDPAPFLDLFGNLYLILAILVFLASMVWNALKDPSIMIQRQSQVIFLGIALAIGIPTIDFVLRFYGEVYLFPNPTVGYAVFLILFPLSIGYTIVKYDLFAIDTLIKRTYGYVLTTGAIAGAYALFVLVSDLAFGRFGVTRSPMFPLIFVLAVVFLFNPVRNRVQKFIDRVFYRLEYDYQETVQRISETMRSLLKLDEILKAMMDIAVGVMFIDWGCVLLLNREQQAYECLTVAGEREKSPERTGRSTNTLRAKKKLQQGESGRQSPAPVESLGVEHKALEARGLGPGGESEEGSRLSELKLPVDDPLIQKIAARGKEVTVYDIQADPFFEGERESCMKALDRMQATLIVPLIYEDRLTGVISLGEKKSGKFYRREDVNLLNTLANQGAVALENAMLIKEVIEKERMEEELGIARDLQMSMLPAACPEIEGFELAALSIPARQVGGDFFDFIEMGEDKLGLVIADVTGKSVSGALVMAASRSVFRMLSEEQLSVGEIMIRANRRTKKDIKRGMFVALLYAILNARDTSLRLCSAGQTQPILLSAKTGEAGLVETKGDTFPLGILEDAGYEQTQLQLAPGDRVVFYTDGIVEAMNEQQEIFGFDRLLEVVRGARSMAADALLKEIIDTVNTFAGGNAQHDDMTLIVVSVTG